MGHRIEVLDFEHVDHALQLREDLAQVSVISSDGDRHSRATCLVGRADRERLDVEAAGAKEARNAIERAGAIDHEGAHDVPSLDGVGLAGGDRGRARRTNGHSAPPSTMSERPLPGSIIGYTFCASSRWKSINAGPGVARAAAMTRSTSSIFVARQAGMPYDSHRRTRSGPISSAEW